MLRAHHLAVVVRDLDASERFYCGVLGLPIIQRWQTPEGLPRSIWVSLGDTSFLAIERASAEAPKRADEAPGLHCLAFAIHRSERESYRARLTAAGHPIERETRFTLYTRDPDGALIGLSHHPDATPE